MPTISTMRLLFWALMPFLALTLVIGAAVLWLRTKRLPALIQVITSGVVLALVALEALARYLDEHQMPDLLQFFRLPLVELVEQIIIIIGFVDFPAAYLWHAFTEKRI
jgi:hypothetical protein